MLFPTVFRVRHALLGVNDKNIMHKLCEASLRTAGMVESDFKSMVRGSACVRDRKVVSLNELVEACGFGVEQKIRGVERSLCGRLSLVKVEIGLHEIATCGILDGMADDVAVAICFAKKDEGSSTELRVWA